MKTKFLQDLGLEKEVIDAIFKENGKDIENAKNELSGLQETIDTLQTQLDTANGTIKLRDEQLETIKNSPDNPETLKATITTLQEDNRVAKETHEKEMHDFKVSNALERALTIAKAKNPKAVQALLELGENIELDKDGNIKGLDDKINELKKSDDYLFEPEVTQTTVKGATPTATNPQNPNPTVKKDSEKSYEDFVAEATNQE